MSAIDSYLHLAMMFRDNHAHSFKTKLEKMAEIILYEKAPTAMTVSEIITALRDEYSLDFTDTEIANAIEGPRGSNNIVCINRETRRQENRKYILTEKTATEIEKRNISISAAEICSLYISEQSGPPLDETQLENLLCRYLHQCFIQDANIIMRLITREDSKRTFLSDTDTEEDFSTEEKETINRFIDWDNPEKDKFVCQMVACCFDYCSMTAKADSTIFEEIFKEKNYILDTDIIFSMIGINQGAEKQVIDAFIKKCNEAGIQPAVTNFTRNEITDAINRNVNRIRDLSGQSQPLRPSLIRECADTGVDETFYQLYYEWSQADRYGSGNIEEFREELLITAESVCHRFIHFSGTLYDMTKPEEFESLSQDLHRYKTAHKEHGRIETTKTDVNNYLFVSEKNESAGIQNSTGLNCYLITTDHSFCNWARKRKPGAIPEVTLPSVWYSITLHYSGRAAKEDYAAFTRFLHFSCSTDAIRQYEKKTILLRKISLLNEPINIKEGIMLDAGKKLSAEHKDADETTIDNLIRESAAAVTEKEAAEAIAEKEREKKQDLEKQLADLKAEIDKMANQHRQEIIALKKNAQQAKIQYENKIRYLKTESTQREKEIKQEERNRYIRQSAEAAAKQKRKHYITAFTIMILIIITVIIWVCFSLLKRCEIPEGTFIAGSIALGIIAIVDFILILVFYKGRFCSLKTDKIKERELNRIKKENETDSTILQESDV